MFGVYISHPEVRIDPAIPVPNWSLSETGAERARTAASADWVRRLTRIISSDETKAIETAEIFAAAAGLNIEIHEDMGENDRSATCFLPPSEFEAAADWFFANPQESFHGWERAIDAQARIVSKVRAALDGHDASKPVAFIGHGGVGTLLKCQLKAVPIDRVEDQRGGGNLFAFSLADMSVSCDWTPIEGWRETR